MRRNESQRQNLQQGMEVPFPASSQPFSLPDDNELGELLLQMQSHLIHSKGKRMQGQERHIPESLLVPLTRTQHIFDWLPLQNRIPLPAN
jgi:hypothetical protein